jgi:S1-C subfamily serine protease
MTALLLAFLVASPAVFSTRSAVLILDTDKYRGLCVAISPGQCVTSYHVVEGRGFDFRLTDYRHRSFNGKLAWHNKRKDLALILVDVGDLFPLRFAKRLPVETEDVWTWVIYEDRTIHLIEGRWAGAREFKGDMYHVVDGYTEPGTSGSATVNANGEIVAVLVASYNAQADKPTAQFIRPLAFVQPVLNGVR